MNLSPEMTNLIASYAVRSAHHRPQHRRQILPRASALEKLTDYDRKALLDAIRTLLEKEVGQEVLATSIGRRQFLRRARDRMKRLEMLAHSYGYWLTRYEASSDTWEDQLRKDFNQLDKELRQDLERLQNVLDKELRKDFGGLDRELDKEMQQELDRLERELDKELR